MTKKDIKNVEKKINKIKKDFLRELDNLRLERDQRIQKILDESKMRKIRKSL